MDEREQTQQAEEMLFDLPELQGELDRVWIRLKEDQSRSVTFEKSMSTASLLNSCAIILLAIALMMVIKSTLEVRNRGRA